MTKRDTPAIGPLRQALPLLLLLLLLAQSSHAIHLDIHIPLLQSNGSDDDCLTTETLRANELLRSHSRAAAADSPITEQIDLFTTHTPHITLFLADFDLESNDDGGGVDETKLGHFLEAISALNFTHILRGLQCTLSLTNESLVVPPDDYGEDDGSNNSHRDDHKFYTINGDYTMLRVQNTLCLRALSAAVLGAARAFVKHPVVVPSWAASLAEPQRSAAIYRSRAYGSPSVLEGFLPHLTVGFDSAEAKENDELPRMPWRIDAMEQWNDGVVQMLRRRPPPPSLLHGCSSKIEGIAVGRNSVGGTVLANSRMKYWSLREESEEQDDASDVSIE
jgi:hypothetical protein